jgi:hypothetical protein
MVLTQRPLLPRRFRHSYAANLFDALDCLRNAAGQFLDDGFIEVAAERQML